MTVLEHVVGIIWCAFALVVVCIVMFFVWISLPVWYSRIRLWVYDLTHREVR